MWVGIGLLVLSWLFPPWKYVEVSNYSKNSASRFEGCIFVFYSMNKPWDQYRSYSVDFQRLLLADLVIVALTAGAIATLKLRSG